MEVDKETTKDDNSAIESNIEDSEKATNKSEKIYRCNQCGIEVSRKDVLKRHKEISCKGLNARKSYEERMEKLEEENKQLKEKDQDLQTQNNMLKDDIKRLERSVMQIQQKIKNLTAKVNYEQKVDDTLYSYEEGLPEHIDDGCIGRSITRPSKASGIKELIKYAYTSTYHPRYNNVKIDGDNYRIWSNKTKSWEKRRI